MNGGAAMDGQTHWVQVIGDGVTQATVTYNDLSGTLIQFHLKDGRRVEVKNRGTLATLCSVSNRYQGPRAYVQLKDSTGYASSDVEVYGDDSFAAPPSLVQRSRAHRVIRRPLRCASGLSRRDRICWGRRLHVRRLTLSPSKTSSGASPS